jgi:metal-responsive CopG/Arc/MetJ family transcriptional regulator
MQATINISLSKETLAALDDLTRKENVSVEDIINEAVKQYLFFRKLTLLRERLSARAQAIGINNEQDVFNLIS